MNEILAAGTIPSSTRCSGAYALDALDPDERARVDAYLAGNRRPRDEVDELRESAASLALAPVDDVELPPGLWDRISASIDEEPARVRLRSRPTPTTAHGAAAAA